MTQKSFNDNYLYTEEISPNELNEYKEKGKNKKGQSPKEQNKKETYKREQQKNKTYPHQADKQKNELPKKKMAGPKKSEKKN